MSKGLKTFLGAALVATTVFAASAQANHGVPVGHGGTPPARGNGPVIYVYGDGPGGDLFYDSIVLSHLPFSEGLPWQELEGGGPSGLMTEFGLGDEGYFGGRWFMDTDATEGPSAGDVFFLCPLLGPGRDEI